MIFQRLYCAVLNPLGRKAQKISEKNRDSIVFTALLFMTVLYVLDAFFENIGSGSALQELTYDPRVTMIIGSVLILIAAIFSIKGELKPLKLRLPFVVVYCAAFALIFIAGSIHYVGAGYHIFPLMMVFVFPALFLVWGNRTDVYRMYRLLAGAVCIAGLAIFVVTVLAAPDADGGRYQGLTGNPNALGFSAVASLAGALYLLLTEKGWRLILPAVCAAGNFGLLLLSESRSSLLCAFCVLFCAGAVLIRGGRKNEAAKQRGRRTAVIAVALIVGFPLAQLAVQNPGLIQWNPLPAISASPAEPAAVSEPAPAVSVPGSSVLSGNLSQKNDSAVSDLTDRFPSKGESLNGFSSGRIAGWKVFLSKVTLTGVDPTSERIYVDGIFFQSAHNAPLDIAYRCGAFAGVFYLLMLLGAFFFALRKIFSRGCFSPHLLFPCIGILSSFFISMLDVPILPFDSTGTSLFFLSLTPLVFFTRSDTQGAPTEEREQTA
ncbi:MAG: hypothetical protein FWF33_02280 [Clostridiales bacterium]|nr:hypothetical protein [Clostridiales bacterium]